MLYINYKEKVNYRVKKHINFEILKIGLIVSLHFCSLLKVRLLLFLIHETKNKCKRVTGLWNKIICVVCVCF